jgi:leucine-rich repeat protein SHOC2
MQLLDLNDDCLLYIMSMLKNRDKFVMQRVCKKMRTLSAWFLKEIIIETDTKTCEQHADWISTYKPRLIIDLSFNDDPFVDSLVNAYGLYSHDMDVYDELFTYTQIKSLCITDTFHRFDFDKLQVFTRLEHLALCCTGTTQITKAIGHLKRLDNLHLCEEDIDTIHEDIKLTSLDCITIMESNVKKLPSTIFNVRSLRYLNFYRNSISCIPPEIEKLQNLMHLSFSEIDVYELPSTIVKLLKLKSLYADGHGHVIKNVHLIAPQLQRLSLSNNDLHDIPEYVNTMQHVTYLCFRNNKLSEISFLPLTLVNLKLANNKLVHIPDAILNCTRLQKLDLSFNQLHHVPDNLCRLIHLRNLKLGNNKLSNNVFKTIIKLVNLRKLYLESNLLTCIPYTINNLSSLKILNLSDNLITIKPNFNTCIQKLQ